MLHKILCELFWNRFLDLNINKNNTLKIENLYIIKYPNE